MRHPVLTIKLKRDNVATVKVALCSSFIIFLESLSEHTQQGINHQTRSIIMQYSPPHNSIRTWIAYVPPYSSWYPLSPGPSSQMALATRKTWHASFKMITWEAIQYTFVPCLICLTKINQLPFLGRAWNCVEFYHRLALLVRYQIWPTVAKLAKTRTLPPATFTPSSDPPATPSSTSAFCILLARGAIQRLAIFSAR